MKIGYARVSTREQNLDMQVIALESANCEKIYEEVVSGVKSERPILDDVIRQLRDGDVLVVWKLDRLGRSLKHLVTPNNFQPLSAFNSLVNSASNSSSVGK